MDLSRPKKDKVFPDSIKSLFEITKQKSQRKDKTTIYISIWRQETEKVGRKKDNEEEGEGQGEERGEGLARIWCGPAHDHNRVKKINPILQQEGY